MAAWLIFRYGGSMFDDPQPLRRSEMPLYRWVATKLRAHIMDGTYPPGSELPSEHEISVRLGVSRDSTRAGLALLRGEGLIESRRGFRPKVRQQPRRQSLPLASTQIAIARMPTADERDIHDIADGVPVLVVAGEVYPADRYAIVAPPSPRSAT